MPLFLFIYLFRGTCQTILKGRERRAKTKGLAVSLNVAVRIDVFRPLLCAAVRIANSINRRKPTFYSRSDDLLY